MVRIIRQRSQARWLLLGAVMLFGTSIATAGAVRQDKPKPAQEFVIESDEELATVGDATVTTTCGSQCHGLENLETRRTVDGWNSVLTDMIGRGLRATDKDVAIVKQYLKRYYGIVAVNTAPAEELAAVLGLSLKDAQAVVEYRTAHGKFADAGALLKVPGIDKAKIDEQPQALNFK